MDASKGNAKKTFSLVVLRGNLHKRIRMRTKQKRLRKCHTKKHTNKKEFNTMSTVTSYAMR